MHPNRCDTGYKYLPETDLTCRGSKQDNIQSFDVELLFVPLVLHLQLPAQERRLVSRNPAETPRHQETDMNICTGL